MPSDQYIHEEQMRHHLRQAYSADLEQSLLWQLALQATNPVTPHNAKGRRRLHPLLWAGVALALVSAGTFFYFGVFRP